MKIILEENDSFIQQDKHAKMIIVAVTMDDGKFIRFPYSAERTFSDLIFDIDAKITCAGFGVRPNLRYENVVPSPSNASHRGSVGVISGGGGLPFFLRRRSPC